MSDARDATGPAGEEHGLLTCEECISPAEAFAVVGNETRLRILQGDPLSVAGGDRVAQPVRIRPPTRGRGDGPGP
jgi:hypothetical protein